MAGAANERTLFARLDRAIAEVHTPTNRLEAAPAEKRDAETATWEAEELFRSVFEDAVLGTLRSSPEGRFLETNPALAAMLGFASPDELVAGAADTAREEYVEPSQPEA